MGTQRNNPDCEPKTDDVSFSRRTALKIIGVSAASTFSSVTSGATRVEQFQGVYAHTPVKRTPFVIPYDHGILENGYLGCGIPRGDFVRFKVQHEGEDSPSATLWTPVDVAENVDRDATYKVTSIDDACGDTYRLVTSTLVENEPPTAAFTVSPQRPLRGNSVTFDASGSSDSDGQITEFAWDFETDGTVDTHGEQVTHTFTNGGDFTVTLRVTDDDGATDKTQKTITVWIPVTIDIKPDGEPNPINLQSQGVIPVAIRQTADFNPTARVAANTVRFGAPDVVENGGGATPVRSATEGGDLILYFRVQDTGFNGNESQGKLMGQTSNGIPLIGADSVKIVG